MKNEGTALTVTKTNLPDYLGRKHLHHERKLTARVPGVVTGLAWTRAGGEILFIETSLTEGKGKLLITGQLGDVMKESVQIALTLVKSLYPKESRVFEDHDLHIHVPAGAVPKDGPSAGITLTTALASLVKMCIRDRSYFFYLWKKALWTICFYYTQCLASGFEKLYERTNLFYHKGH